MRSRPYEPPPPLPPILDDLATLIPLPNQSHLRRTRSQDDLDADIPLRDMDPETSQLLPARPRKHHVRVQGRLAVVRSVSAGNLLTPAAPGAGADRRSTCQGSGMGTGSGAASPATPRFESGVSGTTRRSVDESSGTEDDERDVAARDRQLRGYGIGGVGNIRRPTEVHGLSNKHGSPDKRRWNLRDMFSLGDKRKGKQDVVDTV